MSERRKVERTRLPSPNEPGTFSGSLLVTRVKILRHRDTWLNLATLDTDCGKCSHHVFIHTLQESCLFVFLSWTTLTLNEALLSIFFGLVYLTLAHMSHLTVQWTYVMLSFTAHTFSFPFSCRPNWRRQSIIGILIIIKWHLLAHLASLCHLVGAVAMDGSVEQEQKSRVVRWQVQVTENCKKIYHLRPLTARCTCGLFQDGHRLCSNFSLPFTRNLFNCHFRNWSHANQ